jgi:hypothetical protein
MVGRWVFCLEEHYGVFEICINKEVYASDALPGLFMAR